MNLLENLIVGTSAVSTLLFADVIIYTLLFYRLSCRTQPCRWLYDHLQELWITGLHIEDQGNDFNGADPKQAKVVVDGTVLELGNN